MDGSAQMPQSPIPGQAPPLIWMLVIAAAALWWLWPFIERLQRSLGPAPAHLSPSERAEVAAAAASSVAMVDEEVEAPPEQLERPELGFEVESFFKDTYTESARLIGDVMAVPPMGPEFTTAVGSLHALAAIIDRLFQSWGSESADRLSQIKEDSDAFKKTFKQGTSQALLAHAGFERKESVLGAIWSLDLESPAAKLRALTVRLCLQRYNELQKLRGTLRWAQSNNSVVIPKPDDGSLLELLELYKSTTLSADRPSMRERNLEAEVRLKIQERRAEAGLELPLLLHDGLAQIARSLAQGQRVRIREATGDRVRPIQPSDVRAALAQLPLPPGFDAAHLYFQSTELPRLFGLGSSTGSNATSMGGSAKDTTEDKDAAAEILARETVGHWAARQSQDLNWPCAAMIGIGAALDYTVNRGVIIALVIGFEGLPPQEDDAAVQRRGEKAGLRRRQAAASEAATAAAASNAAAPTFGARVRTLDAPHADAKINRK
mmetsp:Transcript_4343/g.7642  ORF Transcript_4343/g.7642 Transcript_4343/m.7642 type:complete len:491 (+) Transcript_4343:60-1532(+)